MITFLRTLSILGVLCGLLLGCTMTVYGLTIDITQSPYNASPGVTDNGPIFQQAINNLYAAGGGTMYIPAGAYKFSTPVLIQQVSGQSGAITIYGDGPHLQTQSQGTDLIFTDSSGTKDAFTVNGSAGYNMPHITIRDLALSGGIPPSGISYNNNNANGLVLTDALFSVVEDILVEGFAQAGIYVNNSYYSSVRDTTVASDGIGVNCNGADACTFTNVTAHYCNTAGFVNPQSLINCTIESNYHDGIIYSASYARCSLHDCYFEANNQADSAEGADIYGNNFNGSWPTVYLNIGGSCSFYGHGTRSYPYRYLRGGFASVMKTGAVTFATTSGYAMLDLQNSVLNDCSVEPYPANLSWSTSCSGNTYKWFNANQTVNYSGS